MIHGLMFLVPGVFLVYTVISQDVVFPKIEDPSYVSGNNPVTERIPVYIPGRCPENMLLYPGPGDKSAWICDCKPGFVYFPYNESCYEPWTRGPCPEGGVLWLREGGVVPICIVNMCEEKSPGTVPYKDGCYHLGRTDEEPCGTNSTIFINKTTAQIDCLQIPIIETQLLITAPKLTPNPCPPNGHKIKGVCRYPL